MKVLPPYKPNLPEPGPGQALSVMPAGHYLWLDDYEYFDQLGRDPLQQARIWLIKDDEERVAEFQKRVLDKYPKWMHRRRMLNTAASRGDEAIVRCLVATGLKVHPDQHLNSREDGDKDEEEEEDADENALRDKDDPEITPAHTAAFHARLGCLKIMIEEGNVEVNARDSFGRTPLIWGAKHPEIVRYLLSVGANPSEEDDDDENPLTAVRHAAASGNVACLRMLLDHPLQGSTRKRKSSIDSGIEALITAGTIQAAAANENGFEALKLLMERGGYPMDARDGKTKVELLSESQLKVIKDATPGAAMDGPITSLKLLLSYQYPVDLDGNILPFEVPEELRKPFTYGAYEAMTQNSVEKFEFFHSFGLAEHDSMSVDDVPKGQTLNLQHLLDNAAQAGSIECLDLLVQKYGANPNLHRWPCGMKPLYMAAGNDKLEMVKHLVEKYGVNIQHGSGRYVMGPTALWTAIRMKAYDCIAYLLQQGGPLDHIDEEIKNLSGPMTVALQAEQDESDNTTVSLKTLENTEMALKEWKDDWQVQNPPYVLLSLDPQQDKAWIEKVQRRLSAEELKEMGNEVREVDPAHAAKEEEMEDGDPRKLSVSTPVTSNQRKEELEKDDDLIPKFEPYLKLA